MEFRRGSTGDLRSILFTSSRRGDFPSNLQLFLKFVNSISLLSEMIYSCLILLTFSFSLADEICDRNGENCEDLSKVKRANFYSSTRSNIQDVNISSTMTLNDGVKIPMFGLGVYLTGSGQDTRNAVLWAMENGYRQIDTAARYMNEESVGEAVRESKIPREDIFVVTKLYDTDHGFEETLSAFKKSLGKLGMEYVDLYLMHSPVPDKVVPSWNAMVKLQQEGLIRFVKFPTQLKLLLSYFVRFKQGLFLCSGSEKCGPRYGTWGHGTQECGHIGLGDMGTGT